MKEELCCLKKAVEAITGSVDWNLILSLGLGLAQENTNARSGLRPKRRLDKGKTKVGVGVGLGQTRQAQSKMHWRFKRTGPSFEKGSTSATGPVEMTAHQRQRVP